MDRLLGKSASTNCSSPPQEIPAAPPGAISLLKSEACIPSALVSALPPKSPCYTFYSYPTPPSAPLPSIPAAKASSDEARNNFHASEGGARTVSTSWVPKPEARSDAPAPAEGIEENTETPQSADHNSLEAIASDSGPQKGSGPPRVIFIYTCPSASPVKFRMVYSSGVRSIQQDVKDKIGVDIVAKVSQCTRPS